MNQRDRSRRSSHRICPGSPTGSKRTGRSGQLSADFRSPRICLIGDGWFPDRPGGLNRYLRSLHDSLGGAGLDVTAVVLGPAYGAPSSVFSPVNEFAPSWQRMLMTARSIPRDADVLDSHFALYGVSPSVFGRTRQLPRVVHFHGPWADESRSLGTRSPLGVWMKSAIERRVYRRADEIVTLSGAFKRLLIERYRIAPWSVSVIPPGVDLERFGLGSRALARERLDLPANAWIVASVRRLVPRMGLGVLLEAWAGARVDMGILVIGGGGPERARLEAMAARLGVVDSVRFWGEVSEDDLPDLYRAADVTAVPSLDLEGFGLVALESLACGTPVIVSDSGGLPEAIAGLTPDSVVPRGDVVALTQALGRARAGLVPSDADCRRHAQRFTWRRVAEEHMTLYRRAWARARSTKPKVVYLTHTARLSGAELAMLRLLPTLASEVDPHVILAEDGLLASRLLSAGISVEVLPMHERARGVSRHAIGARAVPDAVRYTARLACRLRQIRPDLVHTSSLKAGLYGTVAARACRIPVIWHVHDRIAPDYLPPRLVAFVRAAVRALPTAVVANSRATLATLPGARRPFVVPYAVLPQSSGPTPLPAGERPFRVGMVGRIAPWKGQHLFVEAFAQAFPKGPEEAVIVGAPMFGSDEEAYFESIRARCTHLGLDGRVVLTGFREDVSHELAQLHVLVHASVQPEPFGQVILEGMAAGLPVIAAAAGGPLEFVDDGVDGLLYPPGDVEALARALRETASDDSLRERLGEAAIAKAGRFHPDAISEQLLSVYRDVLGAR